MDAKDITHPEDAKAIKAIRMIPGLDKAITCFMKFGFEQQFRGENLGNMIRVDAWNYPVLYHDFQELVKRLGIREPELYIYNSPYMNAYTYGETSTFIALSSGLIEHLDREELKSVIGHECGHILCKHVLYKTILITLEEAGYLFGLIHKGLFLPIYGALQYWSRKSELSADRCASVLVGGVSISPRQTRFRIEERQTGQSDPAGKSLRGVSQVFFMEPFTTGVSYGFLFSSAAVCPSIGGGALEIFFSVSTFV